MLCIFVSFHQEAVWKKQHARFQEQQAHFHYGLLLFVWRYGMFRCLFSADEKKIRPWSPAALWAFNSRRNHLVLPSRVPAGFLLTDLRLPMWCHCADPCFLQQPSPPHPPPLLSGTRRGSQTCNKQEEPRRDLRENGHFPQPSENVWSDALNYWGQRLPLLGRFCLRTRKPDSDIGGRCSTAGECKWRAVPAPSALCEWGSVTEVTQKHPCRCWYFLLSCTNMIKPSRFISILITK